MKSTNVVIIDGQGGKIGKQLTEKMKAILPQAVITAVGTNSIATSNMVKGGADYAATGENAVIVACRTADIIIGPIGIVVADSLFGEVTPAMAVAVGQSTAKKILIPVNRCNNMVVGVEEMTTSQMIEKTIAMVDTLVNS